MLARSLLVLAMLAATGCSSSTANDEARDPSTPVPSPSPVRAETPSATRSISPTNDSSTATFVVEPRRFTYADGYDAGYAIGYAYGEEFGYWNGYEIGFGSGIGYGAGRDAYDSGYEAGKQAAKDQPGVVAVPSTSISLVQLAGQEAALAGFECGYATGYNDGYFARFDAGESAGEIDGASFAQAIDMNARYDKGYEVGFRVWSSLEAGQESYRSFGESAGRTLAGC